MPNFATRTADEQPPDSPEALFHLLRPADPDVRHLWSHQADMLRAYRTQAVDEGDVAVELPTGSGKTLVGLLLAEWRRRARRERVAYLCPTRHPARQVGERAVAYGSPAVVLICRADEWPPGDHLKYSRSTAIAVTTYSTLFNTSPRLDDPNLLVFDDAHAGEGYVASMWSLTADRDEPLFSALIDVVRRVAECIRRATGR